MKMFRILDVGQCGFDGPRMAEIWERELGATVDQADNGDIALAMAKKSRYDIILVNRILAADRSSGLEVIRQYMRTKPTCPILLVSDIQDAQERAVAIGAARGFGKSELADPATIELIKNLVGHGSVEKKKTR